MAVIRNSFRLTMERGRCWLVALFLPLREDARCVITLTGLSALISHPLHLCHYYQRIILFNSYLMCGISPIFQLL